MSCSKHPACVGCVFCLQGTWEPSAPQPVFFINRPRWDLSDEDARMLKVHADTVAVAQDLPANWNRDAFIESRQV